MGERVHDPLPALLGSATRDIWVAEGTYTPGIAGAPALRRNRTLSLGAGDRVYGGFAGTGTSREQRDPEANPTILSGEIQAPGPADNSYTVVTFAAMLQPPAGMILDGFTVRDGNETRSGNTAGGLKNGAAGSMTIANVTVTDNLGKEGAGLFSSGGTVSLSKVTFRDNRSGADSSDIVIAAGSATITDSEVQSTDIAGNRGNLVLLKDGTLDVERFTFESAGLDVTGIAARASSSEGSAIPPSRGFPMVSSIRDADVHRGALYFRP